MRWADGQAHRPQGPGQAKRTARQARKVPGVARAEGTVKGAVASESDLAIANYDSLSADEIQEKLAELSQVDLAKVNAYERKNQNRSTVTSRIDSLQARRAVARLRRARCGRSSRRALRGRRARGSRLSATTSASTRTAPACSRRPSASSATPKDRFELREGGRNRPPLAAAWAIGAAPASRPPLRGRLRRHRAAHPSCPRWPAGSRAR